MLLDILEDFSILAYNREELNKQVKLLTIYSNLYQSSLSATKEEILSLYKQPNMVSSIYGTNKQLYINKESISTDPLYNLSVAQESILENISSISNNIKSIWNKCSKSFNNVLTSVYNPKDALSIHNSLSNLTEVPIVTSIDNLNLSIEDESSSFKRFINTTLELNKQLEKIAIQFPNLEASSILEAITFPNLPIIKQSYKDYMNVNNSPLIAHLHFNHFIATLSKSGYSNIVSKGITKSDVSLYRVTMNGTGYVSIVGACLDSTGNWYLPFYIKKESLTYLFPTWTTDSKYSIQDVKVAANDILKDYNIAVDISRDFSLYTNKIEYYINKSNITSVKGSYGVVSGLISTNMNILLMYIEDFVRRLVNINSDTKAIVRLYDRSLTNGKSSSVYKESTYLKDKLYK